MKNAERQAVLLMLLQAMKSNGGWCGETHVQKCAYFLEKGLGVPLELEFVLYKHGPFSFRLRELLGEMRAKLLIDVEPRPPYGPSLVVSASGDAWKERVAEVAQYRAAVQFVSERLAKCGVVELERLGTALYVIAEDEPRTDDQMVARIVELKPHIDKRAAHDALVRVREILELAEETGLVA